MTPAQDKELELRDYLQIVRRRKWWVVVVTVAAVGAALVTSALQTPEYRATAEVLLRTRVSERIFSPEQQDAARGSQVETEIEVMKSRSIFDAVTERLGFEPDVSIAARGETDVVAVSATRTDAAQAAEIASTYAEVYVAARRESLVADLLSAVDRVQVQLDEIDQQLAALDAEVAALNDQVAAAATDADREVLESQRDALVDAQAQERAALASRRLTYVGQVDQLQLASELTRDGGGAQIVSAAAAPRDPVSPQPRRDAVVALLLGLVAGLGLAFLREHFDDRVRSKEDLDRASGGSTVLALVPLFATWKHRGEPVVASIAAPSSPASEAYRTLRTSLQFIGLERPTRVVQVTSAGSGDGKTTTLANLAVVLARAGKRVAMIDCDLRRPRLHSFFGVDNRVGFTAVLLREAQLADAIRRIDGMPNLVLLPSGPPPPNPSELLSARRTGEILRAIAAECDYVLVDSPPVLAVTDALVLSGMADATVVVVSAHETARGALGRTFELLAQVEAPVVGVVLNGVDPGEGYYGGYGTYGTYGVDDAVSAPRLSWRRRPPALDDEDDGADDVRVPVANGHANGHPNGNGGPPPGRARAGAGR
jgi:non-specific protein-tyrosine kinase